jgi:hypothetical protein
VVAPSGEERPCCAAGGIGAQSVARAGAGGAVCAGGVAGDGGAWAPATPEHAISTPESSSEDFIRIRENGPRARKVPG